MENSATPPETDDHTGQAEIDLSGMSLSQLRSARSPAMSEAVERVIDEAGRPGDVAASFQNRF